VGHRSNFVLVDGGGWRLHYSHWAANGIYRFLAAGPDAATRFIEAQLTCDPAKDWLDDIWAEGGAVVDHVARRLVFYGNDILVEPPIKRAFVALLARTWPGWEVAWAYDGIGDLAAHVGVDRQVVRSPHPDERRMPDQVQEDLAMPCHLLTVRSDAGKLLAYPLWDEYHSGWQGPALLNGLPGPGAPRLDLLEIPDSGLHVDVAERTVGAWWGRWTAGLGPALDELWPGWTVTFWGDRYEEHLDCCRGAVTTPPVDPAKALDELAQMLEAGRDGDPVSRALGYFARREAEEGKRVEVSPYVTAHTPVAIAEAEWEGVRTALAAIRRTVAPEP
jgi:hypothetical protein